MNKLIFLSKLFTILASRKERRTMLSFKGREYEVEDKGNEICNLLFNGSKLQSGGKFTAHVDRKSKGREAVASLSIWYSSRKPMLQGSSGQHAAVQHSQKGEWREVLADTCGLPLVAVCMDTALKAKKEPTVVGAT